MFLMTWCIIKHEEGLGEAICLPLEDFNRAIDLGDEVFHIEISAMIFPQLEHNVGLSAECQKKVQQEIKKTAHLLSSCRHPHLTIRKSDTMSNWPLPFGLGAA